MMKLALAVAIIFLIGIIILGIIYLEYFEDLLKVYGYTQFSIMKYSILPQLLKPYYKSITVNNTAFEIMYYNVSGSELAEVILNTSTLTNCIYHLTLPIVLLIFLYISYVFLYFGYFIRNSSPHIIFHAILPIIMELSIIAIPDFTLTFAFSSTIFPFIVTSFSALDHLLSLSSAYSMIDSMIFGLDIFIFIVEFLIERVTENKIASIPTKIDNPVKVFHLANVLLEYFINVLKLIIKILVIIAFAISIAIAFLAYFNIAFLIEDLYLSFSIMLNIIALALFVLFTEFLINISFKGESYMVRQISTSKARISENGNNKI